MALVPEDREYTNDHEWAQRRDSVVVVGLTDHAQRQLGEIVFVELPSVGDRIEEGDPFGTVESVKAVSEVYAPVTGEITKINDGLSESPDYINDDPYGEGWLVEIRMATVTQPRGLLTSAEYTAYIQESTDS